MYLSAVVDGIVDHSSKLASSFIVKRAAEVHWPWINEGKSKSFRKGETFSKCTFQQVIFKKKEERFLSHVCFQQCLKAMVLILRFPWAEVVLIENVNGAT